MSDPGSGGLGAGPAATRDQNFERTRIVGPGGRLGFRPRFQVPRRDRRPRAGVQRFGTRLHRASSTSGGVRRPGARSTSRCRSKSGRSSTGETGSDRHAFSPRSGPNLNLELGSFFQSSPAAAERSAALAGGLRSREVGPELLSFGRRRGLARIAPLRGCRCASVVVSDRCRCRLRLPVVLVRDCGRSRSRFDHPQHHRREPRSRGVQRSSRRRRPRLARGQILVWRENCAIRLCPNRGLSASLPARDRGPRRCGGYSGPLVGGTLGFVTRLD